MIYDEVLRNALNREFCLGKYFYFIENSNIRETKSEVIEDKCLLRIVDIDQDSLTNAIVNRLTADSLPEEYNLNNFLYPIKAVVDVISVHKYQSGGISHLKRLVDKGVQCRAIEYDFYVSEIFNINGFTGYPVIKKYLDPLPLDEVLEVLGELSPIEKISRFKTTKKFNGLSNENYIKVLEARITALEQIIWDKAKR